MPSTFHELTGVKMTFAGTDELTIDKVTEWGFLATCGRRSGLRITNEQFDRIQPVGVPA